MARPTKQGIDYFPLDCAFDDKTEMYLIERGAAGLAVLITIWQMIYSNHGYYVNDGEDLRLIVKKRIDVGINEVSDCINCAIKRGLFCESMQNTYGILTSKAIQKRYFDAAKKKRAINIVSDYALIDVSGFQNLVNVGGNATKVKEEVKVEEKEEVEVKENTKPAKAVVKINYDSWPSEASPEVLDAWVKKRKQVKASMSQMAINTIGKQLHIAVAAGLTVDHCLCEAEAAGWKGFKAEWLLKNNGGYQQANSADKVQAQGERLAAMLGQQQNQGFDNAKEVAAVVEGEYLQLDQKGLDL